MFGSKAVKVLWGRIDLDLVTVIINVSHNRAGHAFKNPPLPNLCFFLVGVNSLVLGYQRLGIIILQTAPIDNSQVFCLASVILSCS